MPRPDAYGRPASPNDAIFPIVSQEQDGTFIAIGTGFFIAQNGIFVTAAHVIAEVLDSNGAAKAPFGIFHLLPSHQYILRPIISTTRHLQYDVAVGVVAPALHNTTREALPNKVLVLTKSAPEANDPAFTYAFPRTTVTRGKPQQIAFLPRYFEGCVRKHYPIGRDIVLLPGPCYETTLVLHGGASGGPVFNASGRVFGINSTSVDEAPVSFVSCILPVLELGIDNIRMPGDDAARRVAVQELVEHKVVGLR